MAVMPVHQRIAELYVKLNNGGLNEEEQLELDQCMKINVELCWKYAKLTEMSFLANSTGDTEWQHEICAQLDKLNYTEKKPGLKDTD